MTGLCQSVLVSTVKLSKVTCYRVIRWFDTVKILFSDKLWEWSDHSKCFSSPPIYNFYCGLWKLCVGRIRKW
jgi:hypothetical protein